MIKVYLRLRGVLSKVSLGVLVDVQPVVSAEEVGDDVKVRRTVEAIVSTKVKAKVLVDERIPSGGEVKLTLVLASILHNVDASVALSDLTSLFIEKDLIVVSIYIV